MFVYPCFHKLQAASHNAFIEIEHLFSVKPFLDLKIFYTSSLQPILHVFIIKYYLEARSNFICGKNNCTPACIGLDQVGINSRITIQVIPVVQL